jgi:hypothetical protein
VLTGTLKGYCDPVTGAGVEFVEVSSVFEQEKWMRSLVERQENQMQVILDRKKLVETVPTDIRFAVRKVGVSSDDLLWECDNEAVVKITGNGKARVIDEGRAAVTVSVKGTKVSDSCEIETFALPRMDPEVKRKFNIMLLNRIRSKERQKPPAHIKEHMDNYVGDAPEIAEKEYRETGLWFYIRAETLGIPNADDLSATMRIYGRLLMKYELEELPNYSKENHKRAIEYWQSWQNRETGIFFNPRIEDPQNPDDLAAARNEFGGGQKGNTGILATLKAEPLFPTYIHFSRPEVSMEGKSE